MELPVLYNLLFLLGLAFVLTALSDQLGIPHTLTLAVGGLIVGPAGIGLVSSSDSVKLLADIGLILLLFTVGLEFSFRRLFYLRWIALWGGSLQMGLSTLIGCAIWFLWKQSSFIEALAIGLLCSMSSTAIGLGLLVKGGEIEAPHGRLAFSILLAQDIALPLVLVLIRLLGFLSSQKSPSVSSLLFEVALIIGAGVLLFLLLRLLIHTLVRLLRLTTSREAFVLLGLTVGIGAALLSDSWNLSPALGAFLAGILFSDFQERYRLASVVEPFRDAFGSVFFFSVGLLIGTLPPLGWLIALSMVLFGAKLIATMLPARLLGYALRPALLSAILLASLGEFTLVGLHVGSELELFSSETQELLRGAFIGSVLLTGLLYQGFRRRIPQRPPSDSPLSEVPTEHVLIIGYGVTGATVHAVIKDASFPYAILELNPFTVTRLQAAGEPAFLGDCTDEKSLRRAGADRARAIVVAISDTLLLLQAVGLLRSLNPTAFIAVRTRYVAHVEPLYTAGASLVVAEELEASLYLLKSLLRHLDIPVQNITALSERFRAQHYALFRQQLDKLET